jgi:hypothetical protein
MIVFGQPLNLKAVKIYLTHVINCIAAWFSAPSYLGIGLELTRIRSPDNDFFRGHSNQIKFSLFAGPGIDNGLKANLTRQDNNKVC